jgi:hypothetical protein
VKLSISKSNRLWVNAPITLNPLPPISTLRFKGSVTLEQNNTITNQCDKPKSLQIAMGYFDNLKSSQIGGQA